MKTRPGLFVLADIFYQLLLASAFNFGSDNDNWNPFGAIKDQ